MTAKTTPEALHMEKMVSGIGVEVMASTTLLTATKSTASEGLDTSTGHVHPLHWGVKTGQCFKTLCHKHRHVDMLRCSLLDGSWWVTTHSRHLRKPPKVKCADVVPAARARSYNETSGNRAVAKTLAAFVGL